MSNPYFLFVCGVILSIENFYTPGIQPAACLVAGGIMGWNLGRIIHGDK